MKKIVIFSQNLKLTSLESLFMDKEELFIFISPHMLYDNEKKYICNIFHDAKFYTFSDFFNDEELAYCDHISYSANQENVFEYYDKIKEVKNELLLKKINQEFGTYEGYILCDDLGIDLNVWVRHGYIHLNHGDYYHHSSVSSLPKKNVSFGHKIKKIIKKSEWISQLYYAFLKKDNQDFSEVYVFIGRMDRIAYRMTLDWQRSEEEQKRLRLRHFESQFQCVYLSTLHEASQCKIPDKKKYAVYYIQDGYLPSNYSSEYLRFKPKNVKYYAWDVLGKMNFERYQLPVEIMPFRKKLYLPDPIFKPVKKVLIATSGPGDWTAQKNRSDEDKMLVTFIQVARHFPHIEFIYRCHPTWVHPEHNGVNSIHRAAQCIIESNVPNLRLSSNIPSEKLDNFVLSFPRSSLEQDLNDSHIVFGEHSVSMIDAGFKRIPFCSVNVSHRRDLFESMTDLGFPHCESAEDIIDLISHFEDLKFQESYHKAIELYNLSTDKEE